MGSGVVSGFGPARNPWDPARTPSPAPRADPGAAWPRTWCRCRSAPIPAARSAGRPAFCGIVGLKQTYGRVSRHGVTTLAWTLDHAGPMTRTVARRRRHAAGDRRRRSARPDVHGRSRCPTTPSGSPRDLRGLRVGVPTRHFTEDALPKSSGPIAPRSRRMKELGRYAGGRGRAARAVCDVGRLGGGDGRSGRSSTRSGCAKRPSCSTRSSASGSTPRGSIPATDYIKALRVRTLLMDEMAEVLHARAT